MVSTAMPASAGMAAMVVDANPSVPLLLMTSRPRRVARGLHDAKVSSDRRAATRRMTLLGNVRDGRSQRRHHGVAVLPLERGLLDDLACDDSVNALRGEEPQRSRINRGDQWHLGWLVDVCAHVAPCRDCEKK